MRRDRAIRVDRIPGHDGAGYWLCSQRPLQALVFLFPLLVFYEVGTLVFATEGAHGVTRSIYARSLLQDFFELLGASGYYLPGLIVVVLLLSWHLVQRDPWRIQPRLYGLMWGESMLLALPLFVFAMVVFREPTAAGAPAMALAGTEATGGWQTQLVLSIGAGIYEELLFRLIAIALLHLLLVDVLALPEQAGAAAAIAVSALAFALYHFSADNPFTISKCLFYGGAGVYLAGVYVLRGFGIVAGTHAAYDVMVVIA